MVRGSGSPQLDKEGLPVCRGGASYTQSQGVQKPRDDQLPGTPPATAPVLLAGTLPTVLIYGVPHVVALQVMAAIHVQYPRSGIIRRVHVVHNPEAREFFQQWPDMLHAAENEYSHDVHLSTAFQETGTQNAFLSISARLKNMEEVTKANREHLATITRRTEQFSPSKQCSSHRPPANHLLLHGSDILSPISRFITPETFATSTRLNHPVYFPLPPQFVTSPSFTSTNNCVDQRPHSASHCQAGQTSEGAQRQVLATLPRCQDSESTLSL
jgi:hypothetical protein